MWVACTEPGMWLDDIILRSLILLSFMGEIRNNESEFSRVFYKLKQGKIEAKILICMIFSLHNNLFYHVIQCVLI